MLLVVIIEYNRVHASKNAANWSPHMQIGRQRLIQDQNQDLMKFFVKMLATTEKVEIDKNDLESLYSYLKMLNGYNKMKDNFRKDNYFLRPG